MSNPMVMDVDDSGALEITLYFDFMCPYAYQTSYWLREIRDLVGTDIIKVDWEFFSLEQIHNGATHPGWHIWEQKPGNAQAKGLLPFLVGAAVERTTGEVGLDLFYQAVGRKYHEEQLPIWERQHLEAALDEAGFDPKKFEAALSGEDPQDYEKLQKSHTTAVEKYGVFGSSTIVFEGQPGKALFLKMMPRPTGSEAFELFNFAQRIALGMPMIEEIKRVVPVAAK